MYSSNVARLNNDAVHFGFDLDPEVEGCLQQAAALVGDRDSSLQALNEAHQRAPDQLEVLQALYKFHFYRGELLQALDAVFQVLVKAAIQGGFSHDWQLLEPQSADWQQVRGPARSFLYGLKALAFIRLRQDDTSDAARILEVLDRLDPQDHVGAQVIRDLLEGLEDDDQR